MSTINNMEYIYPPEEASKPPKEYYYSAESVPLPTSEYYGQKEQKSSPKVKKSILKSVAAILSMVSVVSASFGIDFLGGGDIIPNNMITEGDTAFPILDNLDPDFAGEYAWSDMGPEEYIRIAEAGSSYTYLVMGQAWETMGGKLGEVAGASYDEGSNTLTLENFNADILDINLMGNGFKIKLKGENHIGYIKSWAAGYGGSLTIEGPGTLLVDEDIDLGGEFSQCCLMIDAEIEVMGRVVVSSTTMSQAIYYMAPLKLNEGYSRASGDFFEYGSSYYDENGNLIDDSGHTISEIIGPSGERYYDYAIIDENGEIAQHVIFSK